MDFTHEYREYFEALILIASVYHRHRGPGGPPEWSLAKAAALFTQFRAGSIRYQVCEDLSVKRLPFGGLFLDGLVTHTLNRLSALSLELLEIVSNFLSTRRLFYCPLINSRCKLCVVSMPSYRAHKTNLQFKETTHRLFALPLELFESIFSFLCAKSMLYCRQVNSRFKAYVESMPSYRTYKADLRDVKRLCTDLLPPGCRFDWSIHNAAALFEYVQVKRDNDQLACRLTPFVAFSRHEERARLHYSDNFNCQIVANFVPFTHQ